MGLQLADALKQLSNRHQRQSSPVEKYRFSDDFVRDTSVDPLELDVPAPATTNEENIEFTTIFVQLEMNDFQCNLHNRDVSGPVVVIGIELVTFSGDNVRRENLFYLFG